MWILCFQSIPLCSIYSHYYDGNFSNCKLFGIQIFDFVYYKSLILFTVILIIYKGKFIDWSLFMSSIWSNNSTFDYDQSELRMTSAHNCALNIDRITVQILARGKAFPFCIKACSSCSACCGSGCLVYSTTELTPNVPYWIKIWARRVNWPVQYANVLCLEVVHCNNSCMWPCVVCCPNSMSPGRWRPKNDTVTGTATWFKYAYWQ